MPQGRTEWMLFVVSIGCLLAFLLLNIGLSTGLVPVTLFWLCCLAGSVLLLVATLVVYLVRLHLLQQRRFPSPPVSERVRTQEKLARRRPASQIGRASWVAQGGPEAAAAVAARARRSDPTCPEFWSALADRQRALAEECPELAPAQMQLEAAYLRALKETPDARS